MIKRKHVFPQALVGARNRGRQPTQALPHQPGVMQPNVTRAAQMKSMTVAPPVYRPQPVPKVLQSKMNGGQSGTTSGITKAAPAVSKPSQREQSIVQPFASRIVQATKYYPNLHPGAVEPVDPGS